MINIVKKDFLSYDNFFMFGQAKNVSEKKLSCSEVCAGEI